MPGVVFDQRLVSFQGAAHTYDRQVKVFLHTLFVKRQVYNASTDDLGQYKLAMPPGC